VFKATISCICLTLAVVVVNESTATEQDPTKPFEYSNIMTGQKNINKGFVLSSIIHGDGIHTAVINKKIYHIFDYIDEYKITAINSDSVILRSKSERLKLSIFKRTGFESKVIKNMVVN
jgi:MSHA biogenesis protein MshK